MPLSCAIWQCASIPPGRTSLPVASITSSPLRSWPSVAILPSRMPISARKVSDAVASVPPLITRSCFMLSSSPPFLPKIGQLSVQTVHQAHQFCVVGLGHRRPGCTDLGTGQHATTVQDFLADGETKAKLLLIADHRQVGIKQVFCAIDIACLVSCDHLHQHFGIC